MTIDPIKDLGLVRLAYVQRRRQLARTSVESGQNNNQPFASISSLNELQQIQIAIEAIDRSITDERQIAERAAAAADMTDGSEANAYGYDDA